MKLLDASKLSTKSLLQHVPLFSSLSDQAFARISTETASIRLKKGNILFHRGDPCDGFYVLILGQVKLSLNSLQGSQKIIEIINPSQSFGESQMFLGSPHPVTAEALSDSLLVHISRENALSWLETDTLFLRRIFENLSHQVHSTLLDVELYLIGSSVQRVICYLLRQCPESVNEITLQLPASKLVMASLIGITPETFSRVLYDLSNQQLLKAQGRTIFIPNIQALRKSLADKPDTRTKSEG